MARILFVDDEESVLDAVESVLRKDRGRWEMVFTLDGAQALQELRKAPFDLVVSDMDMPGMTGAELLAHVKDEQPSAARMILSGHTQREVILRTVPAAQQYLAKPCDAATLRTVIDRTLAMRELLGSEKLRAIAGKVGALPTAPYSYAELIRAATRRDTTKADFTAIVFATAGARQIEGLFLKQLAADSFRTAQLATRFLGESPLSDEAYTASMLRDVGKIVFAIGMPAELSRALREAKETGRPLHEVETRLFGVSHAETGAWLLGLWGLPFSIVEAVAFQHKPSAITGGPRELLAVVHAAAAIVDGEEGFDLPFFAAAGFEGRLRTWCTQATELAL
jgi:DNA-binding NarL/FixJ family response regulator